MSLVFTPAYAQSFTVQNGQTVGTQIMNNLGDVGTVESGGTISGASDGIQVNGADQTITNNGTVIGAAGFRGIFGAGPNAVVINNGSISGTDGVNILTITSLTNTGTITANLANGVNANGGIETFINGGTISAQRFGLYTSGSGLDSFFNSGTIIGGDDAVEANNTTGSFINTGILTGGTVMAGHGANLDATTTFFNSGTITGSDNGVRIRGVTRFENTGTISGPNHGAEVDNASTFINSGTISSTLTGIELDGITGSFFNSGTITGDDAVIQGQDFGSFTNSGALTGSDDGILADDIGSFFNSGTVESAGDEVINAVNISNFTNTGLIRNTNSFRTAVVIQNTLTNFNNSGTIEGQNGAIYADGLGNLINSGRIIGGTGNAIAEGGAVDTNLTLLGGSIIEGGIDLGGGINTLNIGTGLSIDTSFVGTAPVIGSTNGAPVVISGNQVLVIDPTGLATSSIFLSDITSAMFNAIDHLPADAVYGMSTQGDDVEPADKPVSYRAFLTGFGGTTRNSDTRFADSDHIFGGVMVGAEGQAENGAVFGAFGGYSQSRSDTQFSSWEVDADAVIGGLYWKQRYDKLRLHASFVGGISEHSYSRKVANNLVTGGLEFGTGKAQSWFIATALTLSTKLSQFTENSGLEGSVRLSHAHLFQDGYTETGVTNPLTVSTRTLHQFEARAQLNLPKTIIKKGGSRTRFELRAGIDARVDTGSGDASALLAGADLSFTATGADDFSPFIGASISHTAASDLFTFSASVEAQPNLDGGFGAVARFAAKARLFGYR